MADVLAHAYLSVVLPALGRFAMRIRDGLVAAISTLSTRSSSEAAARDRWHAGGDWTAMLAEDARWAGDWPGRSSS